MLEILEEKQANYTQRITMNHLFYNAFIILALLSTASVRAQVTIGSDNPPNKGAMLDLKEYEDETALSGGRNAARGMMMPRIRLTDLNSMSDLSIPANEYLEHTGLVVYNLNQCLDYGVTDSKGLYVWDGKKWIRLGKKSQSPEVFEFVDNRDPANPETYLYRKFGDAGTWMLENMRAKIYQQGGTPPTLGIVTPPSADPIQKLYAYPGLSGNGTSTTYFDMLPEIGLLYNFAAVTNNENIAVPARVNQGQVVGAVPGPNEVENAVASGRVQGICPNGWHVPSDREWNMLEKELATYPEKYSTNSGTYWDPAWETGETNRGNGTYGDTMKTPCLPPGMSGSAIGKSFPASQGGFNLYLTGFGSADSGALINYGGYAYLRTSSSSADTSSSSESVNVRASYHRSLGEVSAYVGRIFSFQNNLMTVRCKKND